MVGAEVDAGDGDAMRLRVVVGIMDTTSVNQGCCPLPFCVLPRRIVERLPER